MYTTRVYFPLSQLRPSYDDDLTVEPAIETRRDLPDTLQSVGLFLTIDGSPSHLRVTLAPTPAEAPPQLCLDDAKEYAVRALKAFQLLKWPSLEFFRPTVGIFSFHSTQKDDDPYKCKLEFQKYGTEIDPAKWSSLVAQSEDHQVGFHLLADARNWSLPLPFRFLSYYKLLERAYRIRGAWTADFDTLLDKYGPKWKALGLGNSSLKSFLHSTRDRCAHIQTGKDDVLGVLTADSTIGTRIGQSLSLLNEMMNDVPLAGRLITANKRAFP